MVTLLLALEALAHPIHSTSASLTVTTGEAQSRLVIRAFLEDFPPGRDSSSVVRYLAERLSFTAPSGRRLVTAVERVTEASGVLSVEVAVTNPGGWTGVVVHNQLMCERFKDQVNVLQFKQSSGTRTLLFTPGGAPQALR